MFYKFKDAGLNPTWGDVANYSWNEILSATREELQNMFLNCRIVT